MKRNHRTVGVLMLDTQFPRLPGDIGNPDGFEFPLIYEVVRDASPERVVRDQSTDLLEPFIRAAEKLVKRGAEVITTSCGFLVLFQEQLQENLPVPVITSSLLLLPDLENEYGRSNVGIMTISALSLNTQVRSKAKIHKEVPVDTTEDGVEFTHAILENRSSFDELKCRADNVKAARRLVAVHPNVKAILLECTNMPPHKSAIEDAVGLPVYSLNDLLSQHASLG